MIATFNPITYANKLKDAGMAARIADVQAEEMVNMMNDSLATKTDLNKLELIMKTDMKTLEFELKTFMVKSLITGFGAMTAILGFIMFFVK